MKTSSIALLSALVIQAGFTVAAEEDVRGNRGLRLELKDNQATTQVQEKRPVTRVLPPSGKVLPQGLGVWGQPSFTATSIRLQGNTVLADSEVAALTGQYVNKSVTNREIQVLRELLSKAYVDKGYVNSGVIIPDQDLGGGALVLQAVEGGLTDIIISDAGHLNADYVSSRIENRVGSPLNIKQLQEAIQLLQQDERIDQLEAELVPGAERGEANLRIAVKEAARWRMGLVFDNHRSESIGAEQASVFLRHNNVTGRGDSFDANLGATQDNHNYSLNYSMPVAANGAAISAFYSSSDAAVLEEPFDDLDIKSETSTAGLGFSWPLLKNLNQSLSVSAAMELKESTTELLGRRFSLSPGAIDGRSKETVVSLSVDWVRRSESQVIALRSTVRNGVDLAGPTLFEDNPRDVNGNLLASVEADGEFVTWVNQLQYIRKLSDMSRINLRVLSQTAYDPLLSPEKLAIGGVNTVRGYRENFLVRDNGFSVNLEVPFEFSIGDASTLQLMPFLDYGRSWDEDDTDTTSRTRDTDDSRYIASAGLSLEYRHNIGFTANLTWAKDIDDDFEQGEDPRDRVTDKGLQDDGIHFSIGYTRRF